jgi:hypothetical protein
VSVGLSLAEAPRPGGALAPPEVAAVIADRTVVYVDETALAAMDVVTGEQRWAVTLPGVGGTDQLATPLLYDGRLYAAAAITVPGSAKVTSHQAISLAAIDLESGGEIWTATVEAFPGDTVQQLRVVGMADGAIVLDTSTTTYVVDAQTRRTRWTTRYFAPTVVDGTVVAGQLGEDATEVKTRTVGLRLTDGVQLWASETAAQQGRAFPLGPGLMFVRGREFTSAEPFFDFLDPATGKSRYPGNTDELSVLRECWFDARALIVCAAADTTTVAVAYAASNLQELWELPAGDRAAPRVTAVWHGAVYGVLAGRPVTIDGRTGAIRTAAAGAAPSVVNEYAGVSADSGTLTLYAAVA